MSRDLSDWEVVDVSGGTWTFWKCVSSDTGQRLTFVCVGVDLEDDYDEDGYCGTFGMFKSFRIDGREPTDEELDEYSDDLRALIRESYTT